MNLAVVLETSEYKGTVSLSVIVRDIRYADTRQEEVLEGLRIYDAVIRRDELPADAAQWIPQREQTAALYRYLRQAGGWSGTLEQLMHRVTAPGMTFPRLRISLEVLREAGLPCVFYGDYYGTGDGTQPPLQGVLDVLLRARKHCAYGEQTDYFDDYNIVGWTRAGDAAHPGSGLAAVLSDGPGGEKEMCMGVAFAGRGFYDALGGCPGRVVIGENGCARFPVGGGSVALWLPEDGALGRAK